MDSYIVRIYRRDREDTNRVSGVVEWSETREKRSFQGCDELLWILCGPEGKPEQDVEKKGMDKRN